jgi:hypothetical protein
MAEPNEPLRRPRSIAWIALIAIAIFLAAFVFWKAGTAAKKMSSVVASDGQDLSHLHVGDTAKFVEEVSDSRKSGTLTGIVLKKKNDDLYLRTSDHATIHWDNQTKIVMGKPDDLHPGAIIHITASVLRNHTFAAQQLVILTGYVKVQSQ